MRRTILFLISLLATGPAAAANELEDQVVAQLEELGSPDKAEQRAAEDALCGLAEAGAERAERVLTLLPPPSPAIPAGVQAAIERVRTRIEAQVARRATEASTVTIHVAQAPLAEVLAEFTRQTGAKFSDRREAFGGDATPTPLTLDLKDEPFWSAIDRLLDEADLSVYPYGDEGELTLVERDESSRRRSGVAAYTGPFRFEPLSLSATRGLRDEAASRLDLQIELAWEPRLRPIAISQPLEAVEIVGDDGQALQARTPEQSIDLEATPGEQALTMTLSMRLPSRKIDRLKKVAGRMTAMVPATAREFRVENVGAAELPLVQEFGDATVTLTRFTKQNAVWELHMRLSLAGAGDALASHRGWVFQNKSYLVDAKGKRVEHAGFETTMQTADEIGVAYLFDLSGGDVFGFNFDEDATPGAPEAEDEDNQELDPKDFTWVYETPTGVYTVPVSWELKSIELP